MKRVLVLGTFIVVFASFVSAQKGKVIGVSQLIEKGKYNEAKLIIEEAVKKKSTSKWPRTWYVRGVLGQTAYQKGKGKNDKKLYELYPNQLYISFYSFEKTRSFDKRGRFDKRLKPKYVQMANDFTKQGQKHFDKKEYSEALKSFKHALRIYKSPILSYDLDTNLLYNAAISAYKSKTWHDAIEYLTELNNYTYTPNVPHLMYSSYLEQADTITAIKVLKEGVKKYEDKETLVMLLVDLFYKTNNNDEAITLLKNMHKQDSLNYAYPYALALLYQMMEKYEKALATYKGILSMPSDTLKVYKGIGTCYFNMGAELDVPARQTSSMKEYYSEKEKSNKAYKESMQWFEKAYGRNNRDEEIIGKLLQLYKALGEKGKLMNLEDKHTEITNR